jgi:hypothetical protein
MPNYSVEGADGQMYGPVDENGLVAWAREGRLAAHTRVRLDATGGIMMAAEVPVLAMVFGRVQPQQQQPTPQQYPPAPAAYAQPMHQPQYGAAAVAAYGQPVGGASAATGYSPHQVNYATPQAYGGAYGAPSSAHQLTSFPGAVVVVLHIFTLGIFSWFYWSLMHGKLPRNRPSDPSGAKAFWFYWIPFFNLYWAFFCPLRLVDRIDEQRALRGLPPSGVKGLVITGLVLMFLPYISLIGFFIIWPIAYGTLQGKINELVMVTHSAGMMGGGGGVGVGGAPYLQQQQPQPVAAAKVVYR